MKSYISLLYCLLSQTGPTLSFVLLPTVNHQNGVAPPRQTQLHAIIYGWDDESGRPSRSPVPSTYDDTNMYHYNPYTDASLTTTTTIKDRLQTDNLAQLARLATAFSPQEQSLTLDKINHIDVLSIDARQIQMSVVVCEDMECVTLFVPVHFRYDCSCPSESWDDCVLENIHKLDVEAQEILASNDEECNTSSMEERNALESDSNAIYPPWWVFPRGDDRDMNDDCTIIHDQLNSDEFQETIESLTKKGLAYMNEDGLLQRAAVLSVGPAGFFLRAKVSRVTGDTFVDIPYSFGSVAVDSRSLGAAVLRAVQLS